MMKKILLAIILVDLRKSTANNREMIETERINSKTLEVFTSNNVSHDLVTDTLPQMKKSTIYSEILERNSITNRSLEQRQLPEDDFRTWRIVTESRSDYAYDYEQFKAEYDHNVDELKQDQAKLNASEFTTTNIKNLCEADKFYAVGPFTLKCLLEARFGSSSTHEIRARAAEKLRKILYVWLVFLIVLLAYGWGHAGWCSEFCPFDICYPQDEYERMKRYLALNPPGTLTTRVTQKDNDNVKTVIEKRQFKATETERYFYENLWNAIYRV